MAEVLPPQSVAGEEASSAWTGWGAADGVAATAAAARTSRESAGAGGGGGTGPVGVGVEAAKADTYGEIARRPR